MFGSALLRREGVRGFGIGCSGVIQMTQDGHRQVGIGRIGVGTVTVVTESSIGHLAKSTSRANAVLNGEVNFRKALRMLLRMSEYCLRGMPKSPVHNVVVNFAHGGNVI